MMPPFLAKKSDQSVTTDINIVEDLVWFDGVGSVTLIDVPGFGDSRGRDQNYLDQFFEKVKAQNSIHAFILVIKDDRQHSLMHEMMKVYMEQLGPMCWRNIIVVITHVEFISDDFKCHAEYD